MHHDGPSDDVALATTDGKAVGIGGNAGYTVGVGDQLRQVAGMVLAVVRMAVCLAAGIEVATRAGSIRGTAIALVVDVEAMGPGSKSGDLGSNPHLVAALGEGDGTGCLVAGSRGELRLGPGAAIGHRGAAGKSAGTGQKS